MGVGYSDLNVYFHSKNGGYSTNGYNVETTQGNFPGCSDFQVITHKILFNNQADGLNYNVILYYGDQSNKGDKFFGYYYPRDNNQVVKELGSYYSVLAPNVPLAISFKTDTNTYNCYFGKLKNAGWDRAYNISEYSFKRVLTKDLLYEEFNKLARNRKIRFTVGSDNVAITANRQELGEQNFRFIFIPNGKDSILGRDYLFSINSIKNIPKLPTEPIPEAKELCVKAKANKICDLKSKKTLCKIHGGMCYRPKYICEIETEKYLSSKRSERKIQQTKINIDEYYLSQVDRKLFDGIIVYLVRDPKVNPKPLCEREEYNVGKVLLLEFIEYSKGKVQIRRKDEKGYWWAEEPVPYNDDKQLLEQLKQINQQAKDEVVTIILEKKVKYDGLVDLKKSNKKTYTQYTHQVEKPNKPNLLFGRKTIPNDPIKSTQVKPKNVEVYYLKTNDGEDKQPFLIVFDPDGGQKKNKKAYHFDNEYGFEKWKEFKFFDKVKSKDLTDEDLVEKLEDRLRRIEDNLSCIENLNLLRLFAHKILIGEDPPTPKEEKVPVVPRPDVKKPKTVVEGFNLEIFLGSIGGVVGLLSLIGGYGIYWYNTTIKLLT